MELFCAQRHGDTKKKNHVFHVTRKRNQARNCMKKLQLEDSTIIEDSAAILAEQKNDYKELYSRSENESNKEISNMFLNNLALTELNC